MDPPTQAGAEGQTTQNGSAGAAQQGAEGAPQLPGENQPTGDAAFAEWAKNIPDEFRQRLDSAKDAAVAEATKGQGGEPAKAGEGQPQQVQTVDLEPYKAALKASGMPDSVLEEIKDAAALGVAAKMHDAYKAATAAAGAAQTAEQKQADWLLDSAATTNQAMPTKGAQAAGGGDSDANFLKRFADNPNPSMEDYERMNKIEYRPGMFNGIAT